MSRGRPEDTARTAEVEAGKAETSTNEQQFYGGREAVMPREEPGIVITGAEQFGGEQGFIPAPEAEKAGVRVTGKETAAPAAPLPGEEATETTTRTRRTKASTKKGRK